MPRTATLAWTGAFLLAGLPLVAVQAQDSTQHSTKPADSTTEPTGTFHYTGDVEGKFSDGSFTVVSGPGGYTISATEKRASGSVAWTGSGTLEGKSLMVSRAENEVGITGALTQTGSATTLEYVAVFDHDWDNATVTVYRKDSAGKATQIGTAAIENRIPFWEKQPGDLLALEEKLVTQAMNKEIDINKTFQLGTYTSLGIKVGAQLLTGTNESSFMKEGDTAFRLSGKGDPVWIRTIVQGGPTVSWGHTIPIGASGASISAGFSAGVTLGYTCDDQFTRPESIDDGAVLKQLVEDLPAKGFTLPMNADKALAQPEGTRRSLLGAGSLALSGGAAFGYRLDELGALTNDVQVGVDVGVAVTWGLSGNLQLDYERQGDSLAHLRWTRSGAMTTSVGVSFLLGLYVAPTAETSAETTVAGKTSTNHLNGPIVAVVNKGEAYTCVSFNASQSWLDQSQMVFDLTLDLAEPAARVAFEAAVIGDLRPAQALAAANQRAAASAVTKSDAGLKAYTITSTLTDALTNSVHFSAFQVVSYDRATQTSNVHIDVESLDGSHSATDVYSYGKQVKGFFAHLFGGGDRSVSSSASNKTVVAADGKSTSGQQVTFSFDQTLVHASHEKVDEELAMAGSLFGESTIAGDVQAAHAEQAKNGIDQLKVHLDATFGTAALAKILAADDNAFYAAYGSASVPGDTTYSNWTPDRITLLQKTSLVQDQNATQAQEALREEAWDLYYAKDTAKLLDKARASSKDPSAQVEQFRNIAKQSGFDLRSLVALCELAGQADAHVSMSLTASGVSFSHAQGAASSLPAGP